MSLNIFQIWDSLGRVTPFAVRRDNWSSEYYTIVEKIECTNYPYGKAYGYPTINGEYSNHYNYDKKWREEKLIPSCGSYQWSLVVSEEVEPTTEVVKKAQELENINVYSINSKFEFGKHKGLDIAEVFKRNPSYLTWAIINVEKFCIAQTTIDFLNQLDSEFKIDQQMQLLNSQKINETLE